jgi:small subunit ribosomal protein S16
MLAIRLSRVGKKNKPLYRVIISEKSKDLYGNSLEILGSYNPHTKELKINAEKTKYWISKGAGMSETVNNLLVEKKIIEGKKVKASKSRQAKKAPAPVAPAAAPAPVETPKAETPAA